uniref:Uncharacterized protein n=1 Tax=Cucumis melo TaxID=3656 RepID=A0A9I9E7K3_CUCME
MRAIAAKVIVIGRDLCRKRRYHVMIPVEGVQVLWESLMFHHWYH